MAHCLKALPSVALKFMDGPLVVQNCVLRLSLSWIFFPCRMAEIGLVQFGGAGCYSIYVLMLLLLAYLLNQLDRYMLAITNTSMARDVHYGDLACMNKTTVPHSQFEDVSCNNVTTEKR